MAPYIGAHLRWPVSRISLPFRVRVVEPGLLNPTEHAAILEAVVRDLVGEPAQPLDRFDPVSAPKAREFDLITFPEAFATTEALLGVAAALAKGGPPGCLHMGLRPDVAAPHLFSVVQLRELLTGLQALVDPKLGDLEPFAAWLAQQRPGLPFNVGCVLAVDANGDLRACLHPKLVRSKFEADGLPTAHMAEANLLTVITLAPVLQEFGTVTLQPLICSDALNLETDRKAVPPIIAISRHADCLPNPPNHVDVVSVATCTPQPSALTAKRSRYRAWHGQFLEAFRAAAESPDCARHHFSVFVLANYAEIEEDRMQGGLSGAFLPTPPGPRPLGPGIATSYWGMPKDCTKPNNGWSLPDDDALRHWSSRGFVVGLEPPGPKLARGARVLDFNIDRLPRESSPWRKPAGVTSARIRTFAFDDTGALHLETETTTDA